MTVHSDPDRLRETFLYQRIAKIAAKFGAVKYHPDDPQRGQIEQIAAGLNLFTMPTPQVAYRTVAGCALPDVDPAAVGGGPALEALTGAVVAAATNPHTAVVGPTDPARNRLYAQQLALHLAAAGWTLART